MATDALRGVDANLLVVLQALLEERAIGKAGRRIGMSQPAMSGALRRLRTHFDDPLLVRQGRAFVLTELAVDLRPDVARAVQSATSLMCAERGFDPPASNKRFTVTLSEYAMTVLANPLMEAIGNRAPQCSISFEAYPPTKAELESHLLRRDLVIAPLGFTLSGRRQPVFSDHLVCIVDAENPCLRGGGLSLQDLHTMPHAVAEFLDPEQHNQPLENALRELGLQDRHILIRVTSLLSLPYAIAGTGNCAFVPARLARRYVDALGLVVARTPLGSVSFVEAAHWHPHREQEPAGVWLRGLLHDVAIQVEDDV